MNRVVAVVVGMFLILPLLFAGCGGSSGGWTELITNGSFETGDLTGWTDAYVSGASGNVSVMDTTVAPLSGLSTAGPAEGIYFALFDQDENFAGVLFQPFTVPAGDDEIVLTFDMYVLDTSKTGPLDEGFIGYAGLDIQNQNVRVDVLSAAAGTFDTGGTVLENLYLDVDGYAPVLPYISYSFDLSPYLTPGGTYILRFAESSSEGYMSTGVDNVSIRSR